MLSFKKKTSVYKRKKKKTKVKTNTTISDCFEKNSLSNMSIRVNLKSFISTAYFLVLLITYVVEDKLKLCKPTLHGYNKLARDKTHDILWPCTRDSKNVEYF